MFEVHILIDLKKGISDPEGANTLKALKLLGYESIKSAKMSKNLCLIIDETNKKKVKREVEEMCTRLLTNPVIHDYHIQIKQKT